MRRKYEPDRSIVKKIKKGIMIQRKEIMIKLNLIIKEKIILIKIKKKIIIIIIIKILEINLIIIKGKK